jgi:hypothetical protein
MLGMRFVVVVRSLLRPDFMPVPECGKAIGRRVIHRAAIVIGFRHLNCL